MRFITVDNIEYPERLKNIKNPPKLYVEGNVELLKNDSIAVVGSRNASDYGKNMTKKFVKKLVEKGLCVVSGLAVGIDTIAHVECIKNGGKTIAVLGSGFKNIYPKENIELYNLILENGGAIISEYSPDSEMKKSNFPKRNRIVSGLTLGTLVIEANYRSGTSITAHYAMKQEKPVFCIPNSLENSNSIGIINLIREGAEVVKNIDEIIEKLPKLQNIVEPKSKLLDINFNQLNYHPNLKNFNLKNLNNFSNSKSNKNRSKSNFENSSFVDLNIDNNLDNLNEDDSKIYNVIKENGKVNASQISKVLNKSIQNVNCGLTNLELQGLIKSVGGNNFIIT